MDFTREPIVETIITPREGFRLVIRSSKNPCQEEFSVDSLEVVSFGSICFYRNLERPRSFIVPASDYEVLEIREARMPLKAASFEGVVKPNVMKEPHKAQQKGTPAKEVTAVEQEDEFAEKPPEEESEGAPFQSAETRQDRRKDRKRGNRRRRGPRDELEETKEKPLPAQTNEILPPPIVQMTKEPVIPSTAFIPPPPTLIRDDLDRLRKNDQYRGAFYAREGESTSKKEEEETIALPPHLKEEEPSPMPEEENESTTSSISEEESVYKATPLPEEEEVRSPLWVSDTVLGGEK